MNVNKIDILKYKNNTATLTASGLKSLLAKVERGGGGGGVGAAVANYQRLMSSVFSISTFSGSTSAFAWARPKIAYSIIDSVS